MKMVNCFFCGEELDKEPNERNLINNYIVCDDCRNSMDEGITLIVVSTEPTIDKQEPICIIKDVPKGEDNELSELSLYPTGEWAVYPEEAIREIFGENMNPNILKQKQAFITDIVFADIKDIYKSVRIKTTKAENTSSSEEDDAVTEETDVKEEMEDGNTSED